MVNVIPKIFEPQVFGLFVGLEFPSAPFAIFQPVDGVITQFFLVVVSQTPKLSTATPAMELFVKVKVEFTQATESGDMVKRAIGFVIVVIGSIVKSEKPQGFCALIFT